MSNAERVGEGRKPVAHVHVCRCGEIYKCANKVRHQCPRCAEQPIRSFDDWDDAQHLVKEKRYGNG